MTLAALRGLKFWRKLKNKAKKDNEKASVIKKVKKK